MKKIAKAFIWLLIAAWFVVMMGFVGAASEEVICNRIDVVLDDTVNNRFVTVSDIRSLLEAPDAGLQGYPLCQINIRELEHTIEQNRFVRNAEVSMDVTGRLEVKIEQRVPLIRIMPHGNSGYYLDTEGRELPLSARFSPHILLVSGMVPGKEEGDRVDELYRFCQYLVTDEFWNNQIVQVYVNRRGEYELIPRVGAHQILLGGLDHWQRKLKNLELLYEQGLPIHGWNNYSTINLKYTNQVICTKR